MATTSSLLEYKDLTSYVTSLPQNIIERIFKHPKTCLAIFRELPELAKLFVIRLLLLNKEVPQHTVNSWVNSKYVKNRAAAIHILTNLGILEEVRMKQGGLPAWTLKDSFQSNLFQGIFGTSIHKGKGHSLEEAMNVDETAVVPATTDDADMFEKLDNYAMERWESVLKYIVNPKENKAQISNSTKEVLVFAQLMRKLDESQSIEDADVILSPSAFQFLLWNRNLQVWYFVIQLLEFILQKKDPSIESIDVSECLILLFELSFSTFGKDYACEHFSPSKEYFLQELRKLGLVYLKSRKFKRYHPTRLAIQLANGLETSYSQISKDQKGYIIVETNYRVYAYTNSPLQISLLALFTELLYKFPNMVVGCITRESVREAFKMGITAPQIINFLRANAHPQSATKKLILPETVVDQITLWYEEKDRLKLSEGVLYSQFVTENDFLLLKRYAQELDALIFSNDSKRVMVVKTTSHDMIKKYWKQNKPKSSN